MPGVHACAKGGGGRARRERRSDESGRGTEESEGFVVELARSSSGCALRVGEGREQSGRDKRPRHAPPHAAASRALRMQMKQNKKKGVRKSYARHVSVNFSQSL